MTHMSKKPSKKILSIYPLQNIQDVDFRNS